MQSLNMKLSKSDKRKGKNLRSFIESEMSDIERKLFYGEYSPKEEVQALNRFTRYAKKLQVLSSIDIFL